MHPANPCLVAGGLLREPAQRSVRVIAQARLQRVLQEAARVEVSMTADQTSPPGPASDPSDPEAIHDFRVSLRRLRAWLRIFRPYLRDTVRRGPERSLRTLSRLAGRARDLEVQYGWLVGSHRQRPGLVRDATSWLAAELGRELPRARMALVKGLVADLPEAGARLAEELRHYRQDVILNEPAQERMAVAMGVAVRQATDELAGALQRVKRAGQVGEAHAARIAVKRLRYLLEGVGRGSRGVGSALAQLTALQEAFGELHDAQVLQHRLRTARDRHHRRGNSARGGAGGPSTRALAALEAVLARRATTAFRPVVRACRSRATGAMFTRLAALVRRLEGTG